MILAQCGSGALHCFIIVSNILLHTPFFIVWLLLGFYLHQVKSMSIGRVWTWWFRVWTGTNKFDITAAVDTGLMNESLFAEFVCETLPQLLIQSTK